MFEHIASVPWPQTHPQMDWVNQLHTIEYWLHEYVGKQNWAWINTQLEATIAFKYPKHKTLFLLQWS